ncbi:MAG: carboxypeptidase M32 [Acidilobaceae archaeon]|nr:carboxypeptidase M32 [Acidilobaceae archaeon]MCX8165698.1 carboxypeptidase M32 [Acidilobaceae archaeon]MDW7974123.1 carboxypeptidase M32 [Sulfolobales archaeon]
MFENEIIREILNKYRVLWSLSHASSLMGWDSETYMPSEGVKGRSVASAELALLYRKLFLQDVAPLVEKVMGAERLNEYEAGVVRVLGRELERMKKIPEKIQYELAKLRVEASTVWRGAKAEGNFKAFEPYLTRVFELRKETAEYLGYKEHPYDALLDIYEEGLTDRDVDNMFRGLVPSIKRVLERVSQNGYYPRTHELEGVEYVKEELERVNREVLELLSFPWSKGRLDVSAHPFTVGISLWDVRITTRYEGRDFRRSLFSTIHEFGHAIYDMNVDETLAMTPLEGGASLGVHESQSRFWENIVGRSFSFITVLKPILEKHLSVARGYDAEELYRYFNVVRPSTIRVDADEVTYNMHIYLRYKLERGLIGGEIKVSELPELWNEMMEELLGIVPPNLSEGVLQDIHWSITAVGYFPTYTIGNLLSAQLKNALEREVGPLAELIRARRFAEITEFMRRKIHKYGKLYPPKELILKSLGEPMNPEYFARYLEEKYVKVSLL